ncbi:MAG TPA: putative sulfate exporter family transporter [Xanthomonadaceae bacterium]|nr:putative sulfate exporter family transporter [Xanthomonadaceae bacterium]
MSSPTFVPAARPSAPTRDDGGPVASRLPGLAVAVALALLAWLAGRALPLLGGAVCGVLLGVLARARWTPAPRHLPGLALAGRALLQASVVLLGFGLDLGAVARTGLHALPVTLATLAVAFATAWWLGRALRIPARLGLLVGIGTAICGGSAIAAAAPIVRPDEHETAFAISTIFLFNIVAVLLFPLLGHALHLSDAGFGTWAGTAINDTSSVVAAGYAYSRNAGDIATVVKLTRATLIVPVCMALAMWAAWRQRRAGARVDLRRIVPWFVLWFLVAAGLRGAGLVPAAVLPWLHEVAVFLMVVALTAVGLSADLRRMAATGARPLLLGLGVWAAVAASSLLVQAALAQL